MSGYTPLFDTVLDGTLFGKWPHTGIWCALLSQCDKRGHIDVNPNLLAAKLGCPIEQLLACIQDFMQPDGRSRSQTEDGRRLVLIDPAARDWGWRVVNHPAYREKARKSSYDTTRTESGKDAERKRKSRESANVPTCPDVSRAVPLSEANTNTNTDTTPLPPEDRGDGGFENFETAETENPPDDPFPIPVSAELYVQFSVALRNGGVSCTSSDPVLIEWARDKFTLAQVMGALSIARLSKPYPERLGSKYINAILRKPARDPPPQRQSKFDQAMAQLDAATEAEG